MTGCVAACCGPDADPQLVQPLKAAAAVAQATDAALTAQVGPLVSLPDVLVREWADWPDLLTDGYSLAGDAATTGPQPWRLLYTPGTGTLNWPNASGSTPPIWLGSDGFSTKLMTAPGWRLTHLTLLKQALETTMHTTAVGERIYAAMAVVAQSVALDVRVWPRTWDWLEEITTWKKTMADRTAALVAEVNAQLQP